MNPTLPTSVRASSQLDKLIVLGFDGSFSECLISHTGIENGFQIMEFENSFKAYQWLEHAVSQSVVQHLPKAIVCEFGFVEEENFLLLRNIRSHATLRYLPLIAMNRDGLNHKMSALRLGFDDYYDVPVHWQVLKDRINFLSRFKQDIEECPMVDHKIPSLRMHPLKRLFDIVLASIAILAASPLLLLIMLAIKLESRGPVIYRSKRVGTGYRVFHFLKFRSMYRDADKRLGDLLHLNQYADSEEKALFVKYNNDPRVTQVGKIIRKTSLDELPQLFNILRGEMSIVGNRPLPLYEAELLTRDNWAKRFLAPAGLTGLWQVTKRGKNDMSVEERIQLDVDYADRHSFWFDLKIILRTPLAIVQDENV